MSRHGTLSFPSRTNCEACRAALSGARAALSGAAAHLVLRFDQARHHARAQLLVPQRDDGQLLVLVVVRLLHRTQAKSTLESSLWAWSS